MDKNKTTNPITDMISALNEIEPKLFEGDNMEGLGALLALPEDQFKVLRPIIEQNLEKSLNNVGDKLILAQALNAQGGKAEDLLDAFELISEQIDEQMSSELSQQKRDFLKHFMASICNSIVDTEGIAKKIIKIPIEFCHSEAKMPAYAHLTDAGADIYATEDITIHPGETKLIPTGIKVAIPTGYELQVRAKSGISLKTKMRVGNGVGTVDSGYRDEIGIIIDNIEPPIKNITYKATPVGKEILYKITSIEHGSDFTVSKGQKIAQLVLSEVPKASFYEVKDINKFDGDRGGGYGSTGLK